MRALIVGHGNIAKALAAILDSLGDPTRLTFCDSRDGARGEDVIAARSGDFDAVINLSTAPTGPLIDLCERHRLAYLDASFEWAGDGRYSVARYAAELRAELRPRSALPVLHGFGMNPGLVEAIAALHAPARAHIAVEFDFDTAKAPPGAPVAWGTWSPATCFEEMYLVPGAVSTRADAFVPVPEARRHTVRLAAGGRAYDFSAVIHDETAYMVASNPDCRGAAFLYCPPDAERAFFRAHPDLDPEARAALPVLHDLVGGECVGVAFFDGTSRVVSATNRADHARTFARFGCNGTCWQTACGIYAGLQLLAAARPGESLTVSSAMRLAPYRTIVADAMARVGFAIEVRDDFITADAIRADVLPLFGDRAEKDLLA